MSNQTPASIRSVFQPVDTLADLLLADRRVRNGERLTLDRPPVYRECCLRLTLRGRVEDLMVEGGQTLADAVDTSGNGWRLGLTPHGYLVFEMLHPDPAACSRIESYVPVHVVTCGEGAFDVGFCLCNEGWDPTALINPPQTIAARASGEGSSYVRLFAVSGPGQRLSEIGGENQMAAPTLNPTPTTLIVGGDAAGKTSTVAVEHAVVYNTSRLELIDGMERRSAREAMPHVPGGSAFEPRWIDTETLEIFTRPDFIATESYWVYLELAHLPSTCRRLQLWTRWKGGTNMTPTFFWSADGVAWTRVTPAHVAMRMGHGFNFQVTFDVDGPLRQGGFLASCPPFTEADREALLEWARDQAGVVVTTIGASVEGRPLHAIRIGGGADGRAEHGVAIVCGQHSPLEIMGGRVLRPLIEALLARPKLLETCVFHFVPTVNVDTQHHGGNGLNINRQNLNRRWLQALEPETQACVSYFDGLRAQGHVLDLAIDIHAGGTFRNHLLFSMGSSPSVPISAQAEAKQAGWIDRFEREAGLRRSEGRAMTQQSTRATDYFFQKHGATAFCLELSTCSYFDPTSGCTRPFGTEAFPTLAQGLARACSDAFGTTKGTR